MRIVQLALVAAVAIGGCHKSSPTATPPADAGSSPTTPVSVTDEPEGEPWPIKSTEFLELVPADTPYVLAQTEPIPQDVVQRLEPVLAPLVEAMDGGMAEFTKEARPDEQRVLQELFGGTPTVRGLEKIGIDLNPRFVVYGLGVAPVLRIRMLDAATFERAMDRVEAIADKPMRVAVFHGQRYRYSKSDDGSLTVFAIVGPDVVVGVFPPGEVQRELLPLAFGQKLPDKALAADDELARVRNEHRLGPNFTGYVDIVAVTASIIGQAHGLNGRVAAAYPSLGSPRSPECVADGLRLANAMPRFVFGYDELSAKRIVASGVLEMSPDVARHMATLPGPIPGLTQKADENAVVSFGVGVDMRALETVAKAYAAAVRDQPFRCPELASFNQLADTIAMAPALIPKQALDITGLSIVLHDFDPTPGDPAFHGFAVVGVRDPKNALTALAPLLPNMRMDKLGRRGVPVRTTDLVQRDGPPPRTFAEAWFAYGKESLAMSFGNTTKRELLRTLDRKRKDDRAIMLWGFDFVSWLRRHPEALAELGTLDADARKFAEALLAAFGWTEVVVRATDRGLETEASIELRAVKR